MHPSNDDNQDLDPRILYRSLADSKAACDSRIPQVQGIHRAGWLAKLAGLGDLCSHMCKHRLTQYTHSSYGVTYIQCYMKNI